MFLTVLTLLTISAGAQAIVGTQALKLDGKHYVQMKDCQALNEISTQLTVEARIRVRGFSNEWMPIVYKGDPFFDVSRRSYTLWVNRRGYVHFSSASKNGFKRFVESSEGSIRHNRWYHIAGVIDTTIHRMKLYLNGQLVAACPYGKQIRQSRFPLLLGWTYEKKTTCGYFNGWIDEVRIWNCVRTEKQLRTTMNKPLTGISPNMVGYWNFDDATAIDLTANQAHGTLKSKTYQPVVSSGPQKKRQRTWNPYDLGGLSTIDGERIRTGRVYLSAAPPYKMVMQWVKEGNIHTIIDCLMSWEIKIRQRYRWAEGEGYRVFHFPFGWTEDPAQAVRDWRRDPEDVILLLLRKYYQPIRRIFTLLTEDDYYPVLYYCSAGKARSRIIAALIYLSLGVPEDNILRVSPRPRFIRPVFQEVKRCGGIEAYLKGIGVTEQQIKSVKRNLLE